MSLFERPGVRLATSYYSSNATEHDRITGRRGSHDRTLANIREIQGRQIPLRIGIIRIRDSQKVDDAVAELRVLGVPKVDIDEIRAVGRGVGDRGHGPTELCGRCGDRKLAVSPDGDIWPCVMSRWITLGNVRETPLGEIFELSRPARMELRPRWQCPRHAIQTVDAKHRCAAFHLISSSRYLVETGATTQMRQRLALRLMESGNLRSEPWQRAIERVPREVFVPRYFHRADDAAQYELIDSGYPEHRDRWLAAVYEPRQSLVIDVDGRTERPIRSSTMPAIVVSMLELLEVEPQHRVLEVGTGSGYSTALLCERLGSEQVTSIDIDPELVTAASQRLGGLGYHPTLVAGDGIEGYRSNAPYDRVTSACTVRQVPMAWVQQTRPGGRVLVTLPETLVLLTVHEDGSASGHLCPHAYGFMNARIHSPAHLTRSEERHVVSGRGDTRPARIDPRIILGGRQIPWFWAACRLLVIPFCTTFTIDESRMGIVATDDLSWVVIEHSGDGTITQGGPRRVWDQCEDLFEAFESLGRPERTRFGVTVSPDGGQHVWLDSPTGPHSWQLGEQTVE
jgi:protein-L-isoaspartate O-methyltransferase